MTHSGFPRRLATGALALCTACCLADAPASAHTPPSPPRLSQLPATAVLPNAAAGLAKPYGGTPIDVTLYHYDNNRTGWNPGETDLTPASVSSGKFGLLKTLAVDGNVFAQPLLVSGITLPDQTTHTLLIVATGHNSVYAFDAQTYAVLWQVNLGPSQSTTDVGCNDVKPEYGISSTPVIVRNGAGGGAIYVVAATEPSRSVFQSQLHALDVATGKDITAPVTIAPAAPLNDGSTISFDPKNQWSRASLAINGAALYVGIGSHCDNASGSTTGWLLDYTVSPSSLALQSAFHTIDVPTANGELASIWMAGFAPSIDSKGNVYVITGNGAKLGKKAAPDLGESALRLAPDLSKVGSTFTPSAYQTLNAEDLDFGSGGIMLVPSVRGQKGPKLAIASGKEAVLYLLNQENLGGLKPNNGGALQALPVGQVGFGVRGGPAYYDGPAGPTVYLQISSDVLRSYSLATGTAPKLTAGAVGTSQGAYGGSLPIVSSNGSAPNTGIVWLLRRTLPMELEAYDATTLGKPIYAASAGTWSNTQQANAFLSVTEANGRVYVPAYKTVDVFGLTP